MGREVGRRLWEASKMNQTETAQICLAHSIRDMKDILRDKNIDKDNCAQVTEALWESKGPGLHCKGSTRTH